jgi:hypothetical protein
MGILDDAIREHLDLKRRLGADSGEIQRLEDEAFGPPARPGDPDFPEQEAEGAASEAVATEDPAAAEETPPESPAAEDEAAADFAEPVADAPAPPDAAAAEAAPQAEAVQEPAPAPPIESLDTVEHHFEGAIEDTGDGPAVGEPTTGEEPLTDHEPAPDQESLAVDEPAPEQESLTVQEPVSGEDAVVEEPVTGEDEEIEVVEGEVADDEDVLEETPEFLRETPEDDELWFEQGEPKDFDF